MPFEKLGLSLKALQLISEHPTLWEYRLFGQVIIDDIERVDTLFKQGHRPIGLEKVKIDSTADYITIWLPNKLDEVLTILCGLNDLINSNHDEAFGLPGISGNPENIVSYSRKVVAFYYRAVVLLQSIRNTSVNSDCDEVHKELALAVIDIITNIHNFGFSILQQIDDAIKASETGEKRVFKITLTLTLRESFSEAFNHLMGAFRESLSTITGSENLTAERVKKNIDHPVQTNTSKSGFIYVLINPLLKDIVKIGKTHRNPDDRAKELSSATGVPASFIVAYQAYFSDIDKAEIYVHTKLDPYRVAENREFFKVSIPVAIDSVIEAKKLFLQSEIELDANSIRDADDSELLGVLNIYTNEDETREPGEELFDIGDAYYYGFEDTLQDYHEAFKYYERAARLGYAKAFLQLGIMCRDGEGHNADDKLALEYFKEATRYGDDEGWAEMALIYNANGHWENETKCWNKYFSSKNFLQFSFRRKYNVYQYILNALKNNKPIIYKNQIREIKDEILEWLNKMAKYHREQYDEGGLTADIFSAVIEDARKVFSVVKEL